MGSVELIIIIIIFKSNDGSSLSSPLSKVFHARYDTTIFSSGCTPHLHSRWIGWVFPRSWSLLFTCFPCECLRNLCVWRNVENSWCWKGTYLYLYSRSNDADHLTDTRLDKHLMWSATFGEWYTKYVITASNLQDNRLQIKISIEPDQR